eukprot:5563154-Pleurochrysis_carterae.AAC.1
MTRLTLFCRSRRKRRLCILVWLTERCSLLRSQAVVCVFLSDAAARAVVCARSMARLVNLRSPDSARRAFRECALPRSQAPHGSWLEGLVERARGACGAADAACARIICVLLRTKVVAP